MSNDCGGPEIKKKVVSLLEMALSGVFGEK
jgi:hypothetical protein